MRTKQMAAVKAVHRLLFQALLDIRAQGYEEKDKVVFHLADLFHNVVLEMENVARGEGTYEDVLNFLEQRAKEKGCAAWVDQHLAKMTE